MHTLLAPDLELLSRRAFLRGLGGAGLGLFWAALAARGAGRERLVAPAEIDPLAPAADQPLLGRVLDNNLAVYDRPSYSGRLVNVYWRDLVYPINAATIGDENPPHNRVWYLMNDEGYVHSGQVQPVALDPQTPLHSVPAGGQLTEVCVPYTDACRDPNRPTWIAYRLYYSTTHWVREVVTDRQGRPWYRISDDKYRKVYYADARHLRPVTAAELAPITLTAPGAEKRLEVRLSDQMVTAYEDGRPVLMTRAATGGVFREGDFRTPTGRFTTNRKRPSRHMAGGDLASPSGYDLPGVPWVSYLTLSGISFHGTYWHNDYGQARSHGCLNLTSSAARWVYRWSLPSVPPDLHVYTDKTGTPVDIVE